MSHDTRSPAIKVGGVDDRLLPWGRVRDIAGISRTTAWRMQRTGDFPKPVQISPGRVGWWESELTAWKGERGGRGAAALTPASAPRLPGMARKMPGRERVRPAEPVGPPAVAILKPEPTAFEDPPPATSQEPTARPGRRPQVSPNQFDFGF